jgi:hypothetical protein
VRHPNIVEVHDVLELEGGAPAIVMDLLEGQSLRELLTREARLDVADVARILAPVADALATAHAAGVVHRDLKPDNIFLERSADGGTVSKVLDFGIAKLTPVHGEASAMSARTETGTLLGTPFYMAPEQIFGERDVDARADVWSLGVILYECLAGARPTQAESLGQVFKKIVTDGIVPIGKALPDLAPDLAALIDRMLVSDRRLRLASLPEAIAILSRYAGPPARGGSIAAAEVRGAPSLQTPAGRSGHGPLLTQPSMSSTVERDDLRSAPRMRRVALASAAAVPAAVLLALIAVYRGWGPATQRSASPPWAGTATEESGARADPSSASSPVGPRIELPALAIAPAEARATADALAPLHADAGLAPADRTPRVPPPRATGAGGARAIAPAKGATPIPVESGVDAQSNDAHSSPDRPPNTTNPGGVIEQPPF